MKVSAWAVVLACLPLAPAFAQSPPPKPGPSPTPSPGTRAEPEPPDAATVGRLLKLAYTQRREGNYDGASAIFRNALPGIKDAEMRKRVIRDMGDMYFLQGKFDKAVRLFQAEKDTTRANEILITAGRAEEVLAAAKKANDSLWEGKALEALGRNAEAVDAYAKAGAHKERGDVLLKMNNAKEAAKSYEAAKEDYLRALALDIAGDDAGAKAAFEAAKAPEKDKLEKLMPEAKELNKKYDATTDPVEREFARYALARSMESVSTAYDRMALIFERTNDADNAAKSADLAYRIAKTWKDTLTDLGGDKHGVQTAKNKDIDSRISRLDERSKALGKAASERGGK